MDTGVAARISRWRSLAGCSAELLPVVERVEDLVAEAEIAGPREVVVNSTADRVTLAEVVDNTGAAFLVVLGAAEGCTAAAGMPPWYLEEVHRREEVDMPWSGLAAGAYWAALLRSAVAGSIVAVGSWLLQVCFDVLNRLPSRRVEV